MSGIEGVGGSGTVRSSQRGAPGASRSERASTTSGGKDDRAGGARFASLLAGHDLRKGPAAGPARPGLLVAPGLASPAGPGGVSPLVLPKAPPRGPGEGAPGSPGFSAREGAGDEAPDDAAPRHRRGHGALDALDPAERQLAQLAPPPGAGSGALAAPVAAPTANEHAARGSLESLLPALVRRVAWSGDARKGAVRMELGDGALAGGTLLVQAEEGRIHVHLSTPAGADREQWRERIQGRLGARGLDVGSVEVD